MPQPVSPPNPYLPPASVDVADLADGALDGGQPSDEFVPERLQKTVARWLIVCSVSAVPSFMYGMAASGGQIAAMLTGILIFSVGYIFLDRQTASWPVRRKRANRRTLRIVYGTRIVISLLLPVGAIVDIYVGMLSLTLTETITGEGLTTFDSSSPMSFTATLLTTLVQGFLLNIVLGVYGLVIHAIQMVVHAMRN